MGLGLGKKILKNSILPGFIPRFRQIFGTGFANLAFFIAVVYSNVGLLPRTHMFLDTKNIGRYGLRHVIAAASCNVVFSWRTADRVLIFFTVLAGLALLFIQFILLVLSMISFPAFAMFGTLWTDMFVTTAYGPSQDIAFIVLDYVFGVMSMTSGAGFFDSCYSDAAVDCYNVRNQILPAPAAYPSSFHLALHQLFLFYAMGIGFISMVLILYCVLTIIGETITTGTPFGQRFNKAWFVPRLIFFFAMIMPLSLNAPNAGISGSQFVTLAVAKYGSNMATNAWQTFVDSITTQYTADGVSTILGNEETLIAFPNMPSVANLSQFMYLVRMCMYAEKIVNGVDIMPWIVRETATDPFVLANDYLPLINAVPYDALTFANAVRFARYGTVVLRFGEWNPQDAIDAGGIGARGTFMLGGPGQYEEDWGFVKPTCGELSFEFTGSRLSSLSAPAASEGDPVISGSIFGVDRMGIQENYYLSIADYLYNDETYDVSAYCMVRSILPYDPDPECVDTNQTFDFNSNMWAVHGGPSTYPDVTQNTTNPTQELIRNSIDYYDAVNRLYMTGNFTVGSATYTGANPHYTNSLIGYARANYDYSVPPSMLRMGWVGMSAYYTQIADLNSSIFAAVQNIPTPAKYPMVMEMVARQHDASDQKPSPSERYNPILQNGKMAEFPRPGDQYIAAALYAGYNMWNNDSRLKTAFRDDTGNPIFDAINLAFGTNGVFNMLENTETHPLAQLSAMGRGILDSSIRNIFSGSVIGMGNAVLEGIGIDAGPLPKVASSLFLRIGFMAVTIGFMLCYILPMIPFIYFMFAFGSWVKAVFEAMVAMPLWCLAHIKIDGNGLPGPWATNGYYMLLEIFIRPTMIVFSFLASIIVFAALVKGLNSVYDTIVMGVAGYDMEAQVFSGVQFTETGRSTTELLRGPIDQFMFTIIYVVIVYMIAMSCFKLIDQIPFALLRFMGVTVSTFRDKGDGGAEFMSRGNRIANVSKAQVYAALDQVMKFGDGQSKLQDLQRRSLYK